MVVIFPLAAFGALLRPWDGQAFFARPGFRLALRGALLVAVAGAGAMACQPISTDRVPPAVFDCDDYAKDHEARYLPYKDYLQRPRDYRGQLLYVSGDNWGRGSKDFVTATILMSLTEDIVEIYYTGNGGSNPLGPYYDKRVCVVGTGAGVMSFVAIYGGPRSIPVIDVVRIEVNE